MASPAEKILEEALTLPEEDRAALADALTESLERDDGDLSAEWKQAIARRIEAIERGESRLIPGDEVEARIRARLRGG